MESELKTATPSGGAQEAGFARLLANLTHELKTPLHSILASASLLETEADGVLSAEQRKQVEIIRRNGEHLLELITELLHYNAAAAEARRANIRRFDARRMFDDIRRSIEPLAQKSGIILDCSLEALPDAFFSDPALLRRIVGNLLSNALKFSPEGGTVSLYAAVLGDGSLHIQVADSGIGMRPADQQAVFAEFFQADAQDNRRFGGVGLGLALVKAALDLLNGRCEVQSEPGRGSLFTVLIPSGDAAYARRKILIIEPDAGIRLSLKHYLSAEGYELYFASAGAGLARLAAEAKPELVLLDVSDRLGDGFAAIEQMRASPWGCAVPIIAMSAVDTPEERARGFRSGASDFVVKPFAIDEIIARLRSQLERPW